MINFYVLANGKRQYFSELDVLIYSYHVSTLHLTKLWSLYDMLTSVKAFRWKYVLTDFPNVMSSYLQNDSVKYKKNRKSCKNTNKKNLYAPSFKRELRL